MAKTDLEIDQECVMDPIEEVAKKVGIQPDMLENYGKYKAKLSFDFLRQIENNEPGKLILVTAINPTKAGEGKSTTTVGLGDALNRLGKKTMMASRTGQMTSNAQKTMLKSIRRFRKLRYIKIYIFRTRTTEAACQLLKSILSISERRLLCLHLPPPDRAKVSCQTGKGMPPNGQRCTPERVKVCPLRNILQMCTPSL